MWQEGRGRNKNHRFHALYIDPDFCTTLLTQLPRYFGWDMIGFGVLQAPTFYFSWKAIWQSNDIGWRIIRFLDRLICLRFVHACEPFFSWNKFILGPSICCPVWFSSLNRKTGYDPSPNLRKPGKLNPSAVLIAVLADVAPMWLIWLGLRPTWHLTWRLRGNYILNK